MLSPNLIFSICEFNILRGVCIDRDENLKVAKKHYTCFLCNIRNCNYTYKNQPTKVLKSERLHKVNTVIDRSPEGNSPTFA